MIIRRALALVVGCAVVLTGCFAGPAASDTPSAPTPPASTGASSGASAPASPAELDIMFNWSESEGKGKALKKILEAFKSEYPEITLKQQLFTDSEIPTKVETAYLAGTEPDLVFQNWGHGTLEWPDQPLVVDVGPLMAQWGITDRLKADALAQFTVDGGRVVAFPLEGFVWPMWYNTAILNKAGVSAVPTTTDELINAAGKVRAAGYEPLATGGLDWTGQALFNLINTATMTNDDFAKVYEEGGFTTNQAFMDSVNLFIRLRDAGVFSDDSGGLDANAMLERYTSGKAAMIHAGSWSFDNIPEELRKDTVVSGFPLPPGSPHQSPIVANGYIGKGVWITRNGANNLDAVQKFVQFLYRPEVMARFVEMGSMVPPLKDLKVDTSQLNPVFIQALNWTPDSIEYVDVVDLHIPGTFWEPMTRVTKEAYLEGTSAEAIASGLQDAWESTH